MSDLTINDGITDVVGVSVSDGIIKYGGVSIKRPSAGIPDGTYFTNDNMTNRYFTNNSMTNPYIYRD